MCPDDVETAINIVKFYIKKNKLHECVKYIPIITCAIAVNPNAGIVLAQICVSLRRFNDALIYLNAAGNASNWPNVSIPKNYDTLKRTNPKLLSEYGPHKSESYLFKSPFHHPYTHLCSVIANLMNSMSEAEF